MKLLIIMLFSAMTLTASAKNYYLSNAGNDANAGTSSAAAWQTLAKLSAQTLAAGDTVFLRRGDTFRGTLTVAQSGTAAAPIVLTAYGTGEKPIISGAEQVKNWTLNGSMYQASVSTNVLNFFVNDKEQILARYPNERQYLSLDSATQSSLTDAALSALPTNYVTGSKLCIHTAQWCWEKTGVASYSAGKISHTQPTQISAIAGYGYFLYDNFNLLDTTNEWHYDAPSKMLSYKSPSSINPNTANAEVTVSGAGVQLSGAAKYIVVDNITFEKQYQAGVVLDSNGSNIRVSNCNFHRQYKYGVELKGRKNTVEYSYFREVDGIGVIKDNGASDEIRYNTFRNIGQFRNSGIGLQVNLSAIMIAYRDSSYIHHNNIDSAGYCGISADGKYNLIERNIVSHAMLLNNDGAALKSFGDVSQYNTFRNNFVSYSDGNTEGTRNGSFLTPGIYFDFKVNNSTIHENTIFNHTAKGIFQNSGNQNNTITKNVIFGSNYCLDLNGTQSQDRAITGEVVKQNVFLASDANSYVIKQTDYTNAFNQGVLDSNYYLQPYNPSRYAQRYKDNVPTSYTFAAWQATGNDKRSKSSFVTLSSGTNPFRLYMNQTDSVATVRLGDTLFLDLDSVTVCEKIILQPYTSRVLVTTTRKCPNTTAVHDIVATENTFWVYPIIATDEITVQMGEKDALVSAYRVYDITGRVLNVSATGERGSMLVLDVSGLRHGVYFIQITDTTNTTRMVKFIKGF